MAERFYFDLTDGPSTIRDEAGVLAANLSEAMNEAGEVLEEMRRGGEFSAGDQRWALIIRDTSGEVLMTHPIVPRDPAVALAS